MSGHCISLVCEACVYLYAECICHMTSLLCCMTMDPTEQRMHDVRHAQHYQTSCSSAHNPM